MGVPQPLTLSGSTTSGSTTSIDTPNALADNQPMDAQATNDRFLPPLLVKHREALLALAKHHGAVNVRVFGSMARGDYSEDSDVDLLVDALPETSALDLCGLEIDAAKLLNRRVDVLTLGGLHQTTHQGVFRDALPL